MPNLAWTTVDTASNCTLQNNIKKWSNGNENQCQITLENKLQMWYFANDNTTEFLRKY